MGTNQDGSPNSMPQGVVVAFQQVARLLSTSVKLWHRLDIDTGGQRFDKPVLFVGNHGFGSMLDANVHAAFATFRKLGIEDNVSLLVHRSAWDMGLGPLMESAGAKPASREAAHEAFQSGRHLLVFPGGDLEAFRPYSERDEVNFYGRRGFAELAMDAGVDIVPIVTAGAGKTVINLPDPGFAKLTGVDKKARLKSLPVTVSMPWGLTVGAVGGPVPYLPLPVKLRTRVMSPMHARDGETFRDFGDRVEVAMQETLTELAKKSRFYFD